MTGLKAKLSLNRNIRSLSSGVTYTAWLSGTNNHSSIVRNRQGIDHLKLKSTQENRDNGLDLQVTAVKKKKAIRQLVGDTSKRNVDISNKL